MGPHVEGVLPPDPVGVLRQEPPGVVDLGLGDGVVPVRAGVVQGHPLRQAIAQRGPRHQGRLDGDRSPQQARQPGGLPAPRRAARQGPEAEGDEAGIRRQARGRQGEVDRHRAHRHARPFPLAPDAQRHHPQPERQRQAGHQGGLQQHDHREPVSHRFDLRSCSGRKSFRGGRVSPGRSPAVRPSGRSARPGRVRCGPAPPCSPGRATTTTIFLEFLSIRGSRVRLLSIQNDGETFPSPFLARPPSLSQPAGAACASLLPSVPLTEGGPGAPGTGRRVPG